MFRAKRNASSPPPPTTKSELDDAPTPKRAKTSKEHLAEVAPLAERLRPKTLDELVGQEHLVGKGSLLRGLMEAGTTGSMILVGTFPLYSVLYLISTPQLPVGSAWKRQNNYRAHASLTHRRNFYRAFSYILWHCGRSSHL